MQGSELLQEGLALMGLGMGFVFVFLQGVLAFSFLNHFRGNKSH